MMFSDVAKARELIDEIAAIDVNLQVIIDHTDTDSKLAVTLSWPRTDIKEMETVFISGIELPHIHDALTGRKVKILTILNSMGVYPDAKIIEDRP